MRVVGASEVQGSFDDCEDCEGHVGVEGCMEGPQSGRTAQLGQS